MVKSFKKNETFLVKSKFKKVNFNFPSLLNFKFNFSLKRFNSSLRKNIFFKTNKQVFFFYKNVLKSGFTDFFKFKKKFFFIFKLGFFKQIGKIKNFFFTQFKLNERLKSSIKVWHWTTSNAKKWLESLKNFFFNKKFFFFNKKFLYKYFNFFFYIIKKKKNIIFLKKRKKLFFFLKKKIVFFFFLKKYWLIFFNFLFFKDNIFFFNFSNCLLSLEENFFSDFNFTLIDNFFLKKQKKLIFYYDVFFINFFIKKFIPKNFFFLIFNFFFLKSQIFKIKTLFITVTVTLTNHYVNFHNINGNLIFKKTESFFFKNFSKKEKKNYRNPFVVGNQVCWQSLKMAIGFFKKKKKSYSNIYVTVVGFTRSINSVYRTFCAQNRYLLIGISFNKKRPFNGCRLRKLKKQRLRKKVWKFKKSFKYKLFLKKIFHKKNEYVHFNLKKKLK